MVEHSAVNRVVVGSSPTRGAQSATSGIRKPVDISVYRLFLRKNFIPYQKTSERKQAPIKTGKERLTENKPGLRCVAGFGAASAEGRE